jgi:hypothetical protein
MKKSKQILLFFCLIFFQNGMAQFEKNNIKPGEIMPVEIYYFEAAVEETGILITWGTATEINNYGFNLERGKNSPSDWETIEFIEGHGTSFSPKHYFYSDTTAENNNQYFYRLLQIDNDGGFEYSDTINIFYSTTSIEDNLPDKQFYLSQNYPNPFNPKTNITFTIPAQAFVNLTVYDMLGAELISLINEEIPAGEYAIEFDASSLPSGIYFYRLTSRFFEAVKKMILTK